VRIVLDTNVLVAGLLSSTGPPAWIVEAVLAGQLELAIDSAIREEYSEVLRRPEFGFPQDRVQTLLSAIDQFAFWVTAAPPSPVRLPDIDDEPFLAVAAASESVLVTGNLRHFPVRCRGAVRVRTPRQFFEDQRNATDRRP
jgi:putative PIN family toxin of toxin-antitoxin system